MKSILSLNDGQEIWYSMGIAKGDYRGLATLGHSGDHGGFVADMTYCPEIDLGIMVMGNVMEFEPNRVRNAILDFLVFHDTAANADKNAMPAAESRISGKPLIPQLETIWRQDMSTLRSHWMMRWIPGGF